MRPYILAMLLISTVLALVWPTNLQAQVNPEIVIINPIPDPKDDGLDLNIYVSIKNLQNTAHPSQQGTIQLIGENSNPVLPTKIEEPQTPIRIVLVLDASGSMANAIASVKEAAKKAIDAAPERAEFGVFKFTRVTADGDFQPVQPFTADRLLAKQAVDLVKVEPNGETCLYNAAFKAVQYLATNAPNPQDRRAIILFTDGIDDTVSGKPCSDRKPESVIAIANDKVTTPIFTIGLCTKPECRNVDKAMLDEIAAKTTAFSSFGDQTTIENSFRQIMDGLKNQWVVRAQVFAHAGLNEAVLRIPLGDNSNVLAQTFSFMSPRVYDPKPVINFTPRYDPEHDQYTLDLNIANPRTIASVFAEVVEKKDQGVLSIRMGKPLTLVASKASGTDITVPYEIPAEGDTPGESLEIGHQYCFRIHALDNKGQPLRKDNVDNKAPDPTILAEQCAPQYTPQLTYTITDAKPESSLTQLHITLDIPGLGKRSLTVEGDIMDGDQPISKFNNLAPGNIKDFKVDLPEVVQQVTTQKTFNLVIRLREGERVFDQAERRFVVAPLPQINKLPLIMVGGGLLIMTVIVGVLFYRRSRPSKPLILRPQPYTKRQQDQPTSSDKLLINNGTGTTGTVALEEVVSHSQKPVISQSLLEADGVVEASDALNDAFKRFENNAFKYDVPEDEKTKHHDSDDERTVVFAPSAKQVSRVRWYIEIVEGDNPRRIELVPTRRQFNIGRATRNHTPDIPLTNIQVSRCHARLRLFTDGLELIPEDTDNGTFVGEERRQINAQDSVQLRSGDVFWLSQLVKLRIEGVLITDE